MVLHGGLSSTEKRFIDDHSCTVAELYMLLWLQRTLHTVQDSLI